jgi:uracil-DNA glycosylase
VDLLQVSFTKNLPTGWSSRLVEEFRKPYFTTLCNFVNTEYQGDQEIYPPQSQVLRALEKVDYDAVKVVILGQDPYHGPLQATGLSFAVPNTFKPKPPSLKNIFKEIASDLNTDMSEQGSDLLGWASQGVLLLNTVLTVRKNEANSHRDQGWEQFTDKVLFLLNERHEPVIFLLWGNPARKKKTLIQNKQHIVLEAPHPSPLSAYTGFFGCKHFSSTNHALKKLGLNAIDWSSTTSNEGKEKLAGG